MKIRRKHLFTIFTYHRFVYHYNQYYFYIIRTLIVLALWGKKEYTHFYSVRDAC